MDGELFGWLPVNDDNIATFEGLIEGKCEFFAPAGVGLMLLPAEIEGKTHIINIIKHITNIINFIKYIINIIKYIVNIMNTS